MDKVDFLRFERKWKAISFISGLIFVVALLDFTVRSPGIVETIWCFFFGAVGFIVCIHAALTLRDNDRFDGAMSSLDATGEEIPGLGNLDD